MNAARRAALTMLLGAIAAAGEAGCVNTDAAVFVDPSIESPAATVSGGVLGTNLTAQFRLKLHLGARASGPSRVAVRTFEIASADQREVIVSPLAASTKSALPIDVSPDSDVTLDFTFDSQAKPLPKEAQAKLCASAGIRITGAIEDSLQDGATPVASGVFQASCR